MVELKPSVPHPGLFPTVISFNPAYPTSYSHGFKKPRTGLPALIRASLSMETKEAKVGAAQDVPVANTVRPWWTKRKFKACAATSGTPYTEV